MKNFLNLALLEMVDMWKVFIFCKITITFIFNLKRYQLTSNKETKKANQILITYESISLRFDLIKERI